MYNCQIIKHPILLRWQTAVCPTRLLDRHSILPVYSFSRKIASYPFISVYPFIREVRVCSAIDFNCVFFYFQSTNMKSLTPDKALSGECGFMAANLYAKSIFGEDALANVSLEKNPAKPDATVTGHIRIRAKSQGKYTVGQCPTEIRYRPKVSAETMGIGIGAEFFFFRN